MEGSQEFLRSEQIHYENEHINQIVHPHYVFEGNESSNLSRSLLYYDHPQNVEDVAKNNDCIQEVEEQEQELGNETNIKLNSIKSSYEIIQKEVKQLIYTEKAKNISTVTYSQLNSEAEKRINDLTHKIKEETEQLENIKIENQMNEKNISQINSSLSNTQEIVTCLTNYINDIDQRIITLRTSTSTLLDKCENLFKIKGARDVEISDLKIDIEELESELEHGTNNPNPRIQELATEEQKLSRCVIEQQELIEKIKCQEAELKLALDMENNILVQQKVEADNLQKRLKEENQLIQDLHLTKLQQEQEYKLQIQTLQYQHEAHLKELAGNITLLSEWDDKINEIEQDILALIKENEISKVILEDLEKKCVDETAYDSDLDPMKLEEMCMATQNTRTELEAEFLELKTKYDAIVEENNTYTIEILRQEIIINKNEKELLTLQYENDSKRNTLNSLMENKNKLLNKIKIAEGELDTEKLRRKCAKEIKETNKIELQTMEGVLDELRKKIAYKEDSNDYLKDKVKHLEEENLSITQKIEERTKELNMIKDTEEEKQHQYKLLLQKQKIDLKPGSDSMSPNKKLKTETDGTSSIKPSADNKANTSFERRSILKSPGTQTTATSPKTVTFKGVPSYESSESSNAFLYSFTPKAQPETFDELLKGLAESPIKKKNTYVKRKTIFD